MKKVIGLDFDDILHDFHLGLVEFHNKYYGFTHTVDDHTTFNLHELWSCDKEEVVRRVREFYSHEMHDSTSPVHGAVEAIGNLSKNYTIVVVTSRPDDVRESTLNWLYKHYPKESFDTVFFTNQFGGTSNIKNKSDVCKEFGVEIFVDDAIHNAEDIANAGIKTLILDKPWNRNESLPPNTRRVHSWPEIVEIIKTELV